jgi:2-dehydro-3-deoxyglucarate aldolase/4-hydroxy-2-oxoheptanedioate aldolase
MFDPASTRWAARWAEHRPLAVAWLALGSAAVAEMAARAAPDAVVLDLQHGLFDRLAVEAAVAACAPVPVLARVAENAPVAISSALDGGAAGVIVPLVETADEAARAVALAHYPPVGRRSGGGVRPLADFGAYLGGVAAGISVIVMIETRAGLDQAAAIAAVPGVDMVFIGTGDLSLSLGVAPGSAELGAACAAIRAACDAAGTRCGIFTGSAAEAAARRAEGYAMVVAATDTGILAEGFAASVRALAGAPA